MPRLDSATTSARRRVWLWSALVGLLIVAQSLLVVLTLAYEEGRAQEAAEGHAAAAAAQVRRDAQAAQRDLQLLAVLAPGAPVASWTDAAAELLRTHRAIVLVERRDGGGRVTANALSPFAPALFSRLTRAEVDREAEAACATARRQGTPQFSRSYFVPMPEGLGTEIIDLCLPLGRDNVPERGAIVASFSLTQWLEAATEAAGVRGHELSMLDGDGARLARAGPARGAGVFAAERVVELVGQAMRIKADSTAGRPSLIPNLTIALVIGLSIVLFVVVLLLARDGRRRAQAEARLAESLAFRQAMENSLSTGLRARDLDGRLTYVNPAFCTMVGFAAEDLLGRDPPPYWPPERIELYRGRQLKRLGGPAAELRSTGAQASFETVFMRKNGERFPVMIYEAPLVDAGGAHSGWMSAVLDMSEQRRIEELARAQAERLQASARLATMGEMASLLSHELNQPLAAITSYAAGTLNHADDAGADPFVREGLQRIAAQADRAGRVIKSVHGFVRRREPRHERIGADALIEAVMPLVVLAARPSAARIVVDLPQPAPAVRCDRTMVEQVLLNLARNGLQAIGDASAQDAARERVLKIAVAPLDERTVAFDVTDTGTGIAPDVAASLFTPFYTTRTEGLGLGLSLCRTVVEQHGGSLHFDSPWPPAAADGGGTRFRFTLPAAPASTPAASP
jgi:two-component system sensor histidine kinase DctS